MEESGTQELWLFVEWVLRRRSSAGGDLLGGELFSMGLWFLGDELAVPHLGLQDGPSAAPPLTHLNRLALHLTDGMATAATTQLRKAKR